MSPNERVRGAVGAKILCVWKHNRNAHYYFSPSVTGNSDWREVSVHCRFPENQESVSVVFGIQQGWGTVEFRNPVLEIVPRKKLPGISLQQNFRCEYTRIVASRPVSCGMMSPVPSRITAQDIRDLGVWNANLLRYQSRRTSSPPSS